MNSETPDDAVERGVTDAVEAAIQKARRAQKVCARCGPRVEPDAMFCSTCGAKITPQVTPEP